MNEASSLARKATAAAISSGSASQLAEPEEALPSRNGTIDVDELQEELVS